MSTSNIEEAISILQESQHLVVFTGAGVSTESGIPDFRSPGGIWDRYDPMDFTIQAFRNDPVAYWERRLEMRAEQEFEWSDIEPNAAHRAIADLGQAEPFNWLITQNVDGLHQDAGSNPENILELHGTRRKAKCMGCDRRMDTGVLERKLEQEPLPPRCDSCDGLLKRATVSFGESLPRDVLTTSREASTSCDCFLVVGSSLSVEPAASLPRVAARNGAELVIINLTETPVDHLARVVIGEKAGDVVPPIVEGALENEE